MGLIMFFPLAKQIAIWWSRVGVCEGCFLLFINFLSDSPTPNSCLKHFLNILYGFFCKLIHMFSRNEQIKTIYFEIHLAHLDSTYQFFHYCIAIAHLLTSHFFMPILGSLKTQAKQIFLAINKLYIHFLNYLPKQWSEYTPKLILLGCLIG